MPKQECKDIFAYRGCKFCFKVFDSPNTRRIHQEKCQLSAAAATISSSRLGIRDSLTTGGSGGARVVGLACKMVGGGSDGSLDLCARVCLIDERENIIFHSYVRPPIPVTNYRYETTGVRQEHLRDALPMKLVQRKIQDFLCNGEPMWTIRPRGGNSRILVGHGLDHDLASLQIEYPPQKIRYVKASQYIKPLSTSLINFINFNSTGTPQNTLHS